MTDWTDQEFNGVVFPPDGTCAPFTVINMGHGLVEVGHAKHNALHSLWFGRMDKQAPVGSIVTDYPGRMAQPGEGLACITFSSVESLNVVLEKLHEVRAAMVGE